MGKRTINAESVEIKINSLTRSTDRVPVTDYEAQQQAKVRAKLIYALFWVSVLAAIMIL